MKKTMVCFFLFILTVSCTTAPAATLPPAVVTSNSSPLPPLASTQTYTPIPAITLPPTSASTAAPTRTPSSEAIPEIRRITQTGGSIHGITIAGDLAYVGIGPRVGVIDISQHTNPKLVAQSEILPGLVTQLLQIPEGRLLVSSGKYLVLMDSSHPDQLKPIQQLELKGKINTMVLDASMDILYIGGAISTAAQSTEPDGFIVSVEVTPEAQLKLINFVSMPEIPLSQALSESSLFAGANGYEGGLYYIQVKAPGELSTPQQVIASSPGDPLVPISMQVIGERLYLGDWGVMAYDITNPEQPVQVWRGNSTGINIVTGFSVDGDQVYVTGFAIREPDLQLFGQFTAPDAIAGAPIGDVASMTSVHDGDFIVADRSLSIFNAGSGNDLQLVGSTLPPAANAIDGVANDRAVFVVDEGVGDGQSNAVLWALNLPDLQPLGRVTTEFPNSWWEGFRDMALDGERVYLATEDAVWAYDITSSEPTLLGKVNINDEQLEEIAATTLDGKKLLFAACTNGVFNKLNIYDMTDLQESALLVDALNLDQGSGLHLNLNGSVSTILLEEIRDSYPKRSMLYVIEYDNNRLNLKDSLEIEGHIYHMAVSNTLIVLAGTRDSVYRSSLSIGQPEPLKILFTLSLPGADQGVAIAGDIAMTVVGSYSNLAGESQLLIFDLRSPSYPKRLEVLGIPFGDTDNVPIVYSSPYVILANGAGGVELLEYSR